LPAFVTPVTLQNQAAVRIINSGQNGGWKQLSERFEKCAVK
jgi:hypothetical protein